MKAQTCKNCWHFVDEVDLIEGSRVIPREGDLNICAYCGAISAFDNQLILQPLNAEDLIKLNDDNPEMFDQLMKARTVIKGMNVFKKRL